MKKKKLKRILTVGFTTSIVLNPFCKTVQTVNAEESKNSYINISTNNEKKSSLTDTLSKNEIYLSEIEYDKSQSKTEYKSIMKDSNIDGKKIKLRVDGEVVEFEKGIGAHATSTIVYDISNYKDIYTRLVSYVGIDSSQSGRGDGVVFSIYTSNDGKDWTLAKNVGLLTADKESAYIDIPLNGAKFIKLYANCNGYNGNDHAVYGDAKLVKADYSMSSTPIQGLETLDTYDNILKSTNIEDNINKNELTILRRAFVNKLGYNSIQRISNKDKKYNDGINYLLNDITALRYFVTGGAINIHGNYQESLKCFCDIYDKYKTELKDTSDDNFNLRLATSISLAYSYKSLPTSWIGKGKEPNAVKRYETYKELISSGRIDAGGNQNDYGKWSSIQFKKLPIPLMRWTVDNRINDDEVFWLADYALKMKKQGKNYLDAYNYINYTNGYNYTNEKLYTESNHKKYNDKYNFDKYYNDYGNKNIQRLWMVFEEGSVCGGLAQTYSNLSDTFGRPSSPCGQPGHAASLTYGWNTTNKRYEWMIQNDISGWVETGNQYDDRMLGWGNQKCTKWHNASYTVLATDAVNDYGNYTKSTLLNLLADSYTDNKTKKEIYIKALSYQKINLDSMEKLINCYKNDTTTTSREYFNLCKKIIDTYTYYPQTMMELLSLVEENLTDTNEVAQLDLLKHNALIKSSKATSKESTNINMSKQLANYYLKNKTSELASFSFDGKNAGEIVINPKYNDSKIRVKYSLDGGSNWKQTDEHIIHLTKDELNSITADNDVKIGLVGTTDVYNIDILKGNTISNSTIYANDLENLLVGNIYNLEFSLDNETTWCDYVTKGNMDGIRFEGDKTVKVRYKAHGVYLKSDVHEYNFTKNTDTDTKKYIQLNNITLEGYTSENSKTHAAKHLIDGNPNTAWHTTFNTFAHDKFYTVKLDKVRYITSLEYLSKGSNGKLKNGKIYTSLDGQNWSLSGNFTNLANNNDIKTLNLYKPTACKYIKIVADNTYGNTKDEQDMYFTGNMLNFYEDTTKEYISEPVIKYSNSMDTNRDVSATITLPDGCSIIGESTYVFNNNGTHTFRYTDVNGLEKSIDAVVNWIDKEAPKVSISYSTENQTNQNVTATVVGLENGEFIVNNNGKNYYTFTNNGSFEFEVCDEVGNISKVRATVSWINKDHLNDSNDSQNDNSIVNINDIKGHWAESQINSFISSGYIMGYEDGTFRPDKSITRAEFVRIFNKYFGLTKSSGKVFDDTKTHWAKKDIDIAVTNGVANGVSLTEFQPDEPITREQAAKMISNYLKLDDTNLDKIIKYKDKDQVSNWALNSVEGIIESGYMCGYEDNTFRATNNITRAEAVVTLSRIK
ncbi:MAG: S-layer homology domain-containing protein [Cetobacterium sp.]|nr:S-layer homology domain-containing protein [Cetobacterium sp.]